MAFELHPDLIRDGIYMGDFQLCRVILINDSAYPWFILVPRQENLKDTIDMSMADHALLWEESHLFSKTIMTVFNGEKLNVAALGNMTPQLHIHHIVRYTADPAWPGPIWGKQSMTPYSGAQISVIKDKLMSADMRGFEVK